ncbi:uncharacterized protein ACLA_028650 [Aspergillus clavatus NRRL 1]|uniref:Integral membrane protein n=1 Tax=Aspergillus clavatus (strain ATCC 1007 / CBS 513.65 / DSM 816 / NCTC 3887 / NRRL 1 / QM 1276 / 107) TaxID=344612 RepID=A1CR69_ASPCL|nr:uncharacterized protein ACLA_028650 [Aspergillus clavatus NRRL 1]EAW08140.1 integral membrane protein [Aspergillus clavatus NRRL 1]
MSHGGLTPGDGITGGYTGNSLALKITIATLAGITWYNAIELIILVFVTFSRYSGSYFWSLLVSAVLGLIPYSIGFLLKFFQLTSQTWLCVTCLTVGWWCMVTGQSVVLYSRLHLVVRSPRILRRVLLLILVDAVLLHLPTTVLTYGSNLAASDAARAAYIRGYNVMEKIQMTGFCLQEFVISGLYIYETVRMLRLDPDRGKRKIMYQLVAINAIIILLDLGLLVVEYMNKYILETMLKGAIYSIKLKLEFAVLGKLVYLVHSHVWKVSADDSYPHHPYHIPPHPGSVADFPDFVDATRVTTDLTHAAPLPSSSTSFGPLAISPRHRRRRSHPWMDSDDISIAMFEHSEGVPVSISLHDQDQDQDPDQDRDIGPSSISHSWSGETQRDTSVSVSPLDFTDSLHKQRESGSGGEHHPG